MKKIINSLITGYYTYKSLNNKVITFSVKSPMLIIIMFFTFLLSITYLTYLYLPQVTYSTSYKILLVLYKPLLFFEDAFPNHIDILSQNLISNMNVYLKFSIPLILAFFYFAYKEQKSISSKLIKGINIIVFCISVLSTLTIGYLLLNSYNTYYKQITTNFSKVFFYPLMFWLLLVTISLCSLLLMIGKFLKSLDINYLLITKKRLLKKKLIQQSYTKFTIDRQESYDDINSYLEAIFHSFEYSLENKLEKTFDKEFDHWNNLLFWLMEYPATKFEKNIVSKELYTKSPIEFGQFYKSILRNQGHLIFKLAEENKFKELNEVLTTLKDLEPTKITELYRIYFSILEEIYIKAISVKDFPFDKMLHVLNEMASFYDTSIEETEELNLMGIILIYKSLIKKAIEENNVRLINQLSYSICNLMDNKDSTSKADKTFLELINGKQLNISLNIAKSMNQNLNIEIGNLNPRDVILFVLFQASLKSVELGLYACTGQIVKRITTDFTGKQIKDNFSKFIELNGNINSLIVDKKMVIKNSDFDFNKQSFSYCLQKLGIILYSQEKFIVYKGITFTTFFKNTHYFVDLSYMDKSYINYTLEKIESVGEKYGFLFLAKDNKFFRDNIVSELIKQTKTSKNIKVKKKK